MRIPHYTLSRAWLQEKDGGREQGGKEREKKGPALPVPGLKLRAARYFSLERNFERKSAISGAMTFAQ